MSNWNHLLKPATKNAFNRGFKNFYHNKQENPYPPNTDRSKEWLRGFNAAYFKQKAYWDLKARRHNS